MVQFLKVPVSSNQSINQNTLFGSNLQVKRYMSNQQFIIFHCDSKRFLFDIRGSLNVQIELSSFKTH